MKIMQIHIFWISDKIQHDHGAKHCTLLRQITFGLSVELIIRKPSTQIAKTSTKKNVIFIPSL